MDQYQDYHTLRQHHRPGEDYVILLREADNRLAVMAPHGGGIEPGTVDVADAIAGKDFTFYAFKGIKKNGNRVLHLASNRFDEPLGLAVAEKADVVLTVHGCRGQTPEVLIGGRQALLKEAIRQSLARAGFQAAISTRPGLRGTSRDNICNRFTPQGGVQLELSRGLREAMFRHLDRRSLRGKTALYYSFVKAVRQPLRDRLFQAEGRYAMMTLDQLKEDRALINNIDWDMTPEEAVRLYLEWGNNWAGGNYVIRSKKDVVCYFVVNTWKETPRVFLVKRNSDAAEELAEFGLPDKIKEEFLASVGHQKGVYAIAGPVRKWLKAELTAS